MASGVDELLDMLYGIVEDAKNVPLSADKCIIERDRVLDLLDDLKAQFPTELANAQRILANREEYLASARREADLIRQQALEKAKQMVSEDQVLAAAKQKSAEIVRQAEDRNRELTRAANDYCEDALRRTEEAVAAAFDEIKKSRARFRAAANNIPSAPSGQGKVYDPDADQI